MVLHSNSPYPGSLGPGTVRNSEMPVTKNFIHNNMCLHKTSLQKRPNQLLKAVDLATPYFSATTFRKFPFWSSRTISIFFSRVTTDLLRFCTRPVAHCSAIITGRVTTQLYAHAYFRVFEVPVRWTCPDKGRPDKGSLSVVDRCCG